MLYVEFARRYRDYRIEQLAQLVHISATLISVMEQGRFIPNPSQQERLARALDLPLDMLLEPVPSPSVVVAAQAKSEAARA